MATTKTTKGKPASSRKGKGSKAPEQAPVVETTQAPVTILGANGQPVETTAQAPLTIAPITVQPPVKGPKIATAPIATIALPNGELQPVGTGGNGGLYGTARARDLAWCIGKRNVFAVLLAMGATEAAKAVTAKAAVMGAMSAGIYLTPRDIRHYVYHAASAGLAGVVVGGAGIGHTYYITPAGSEYFAKHEQPAKV